MQPAALRQKAALFGLVVTLFPACLVNILPWQLPKWVEVLVLMPVWVVWLLVWVFGGSGKGPGWAVSNGLSVLAVALPVNVAFWALLFHIFSHVRSRWLHPADAKHS